MQEWLDSNDVLMYSTHNEVKYVIAERFIKTLKATIYKKKWQPMIENLVLVVILSYLNCILTWINQ